MFTRWGDLVYRLRFAVIGVVAAALLALGGYGLGLEDHLSSSGWDDPTSESAQAAKIADAAFGRDHNSDVILLYTAPEGKTIDDPEFRDKIVESLNRLPREHPEQIAKVNGAYWITETGPGQPMLFGSKDKKYTFASIAIVGDNDTDMVRNFRAVKDVFYIDGVDVQVTGLQAVAGTLNDTMASDQKRMELLAIPAVAVLLFFIFGGLVAAGLPLVVGGLTIIGANGIIMALTKFTEVNSFVGGVVSMIGLGLAIDYGLFIVSRFREELAEGYDTRAAVRRSVMTAGRTVVFSATMIIASLGGMLLFPQGFLKSVAYGTIATVSLAALTAITILPAMLAILGPRVDMLGLKRFRKTKTAEEVENSFWGRSTQWVMKHPLKIAVPICIGLLLLIIPVKNLAFGGINERYLPPDNPTRVALENFYEVFPLRKTDPVQLVMVSEDSQAVGNVWRQASEAPGLTGDFSTPSRSVDDRNVYRIEATLEDSENANPTIDYLRSLDVPDNVEVYVGGQPAIQKDSIDALLDRMPLMIALVLFTTTVLMFLTFGSLVLPIKAALMSALGLGSTLGILTWIFVDGHGSGLLNFTQQPIMSPVLVLIIAVIYGLSTDYEVFLLSRMVEARSQGASTTEAVRAGTAHTGRIITAAALILLVVVGAFAFSDLVMMQYIAYGLIAALIIDATILRMWLVPATMKLLGDDCWWAPAWMKRIQEKIGLGEPILDDERPGGGEVVDLVKTTPITDPVTMQMPALPDSKQRKSPRRPRTIEEIEAEAPTQRMDSLPPAPRPVLGPHDPTRPRASSLSGLPDPGESRSAAEDPEPPAVPDVDPNPTQRFSPITGDAPGISLPAEHASGPKPPRRISDSVAQDRAATASDTTDSGAADEPGAPSGFRPFQADSPAPESSPFDAGTGLIGATPEPSADESPESGLPLPRLPQRRPASPDAAESFSRPDAPEASRDVFSAPGASAAPEGFRPFDPESDAPQGNPFGPGVGFTPPEAEAPGSELPQGSTTTPPSGGYAVPGFEREATSPDREPAYPAPSAPQDLWSAPGTEDSASHGSPFGPGVTPGAESPAVDDARAGRGADGAATHGDIGFSLSDSEAGHGVTQGSGREFSVPGFGQYVPPRAAADGPATDDRSGATDRDEAARREAALAESTRPLPASELAGPWRPPSPGDAEASPFGPAPTPPRPSANPPRIPLGRTEPNTDQPRPQHIPAPPNPIRHAPGATPDTSRQTPADQAADARDTTPDDNRASIENWMAELRSSRRRPVDPDAGKHHSGDGRSVSVDELLRRNDD